MLPKDGWAVLQHDYARLPKLLVKFEPSDKGYSLALTDLTNVWVERLSEKDIALEAEKSGCGISPGDDVDQLRIFLAKLESALSHDEGTFVDFESDLDQLTLVLSAPLPKPLAPLVWRMHLTRGEPRELTDIFVLPLLQFASRQQKETQHLLEQLRHKDNVITKLIDRMESANLHLGDVFLLPNLRLSKQKSHRDQFAKHVPGLANYHEPSSARPVMAAASSDEMYSILGNMSRDDVRERPVPSDDGWWLNIKNASQAHAGRKVEASMDLDGDETEDEEFQARSLGQSGTCFC